MARSRSRSEKRGGSHASDSVALQLWKQLDENEDMYITTQEMEKALNDGRIRLGSHLDIADVEQVFALMRRCDKDDDGKISFKEFELACRRGDLKDRCLLCCPPAEAERSPLQNESPLQSEPPSQDKSLSHNDPPSQNASPPVNEFPSQASPPMNEFPSQNEAAPRFKYTNFKRVNKAKRGAQVATVAKNLGHVVGAALAAYASGGLTVLLPLSKEVEQEISASYTCESVEDKMTKAMKLDDGSYAFLSLSIEISSQRGALEPLIRAEKFHGKVNGFLAVRHPENEAARKICEAHLAERAKKDDAVIAAFMSE